MENNLEQVPAEDLAVSEKVQGIKNSKLLAGLPRALEHVEDEGRLVYTLQNIIKTATEKKVEKETIDKLVEATEIIKSLEVTLRNTESLNNFIFQALVNRGKDEGINVSVTPTYGLAYAIDRDIKLLRDGKFAECRGVDAYGFKQYLNGEVRVIGEDFIAELQKFNVPLPEKFYEALDKSFFTSLGKEMESNESYDGNKYRAIRVEYQRKAEPLLNDLSRSLRLSMRYVGEKLAFILLGKRLEKFGGVYKEITDE
ncbi:MAG: hypothetical protein UV64_C0020G0003 [Parcubacteria group bacterium GW2011_GWC1_43_11b]|uniref:Uncharacterized protein n=2 Tax=Candidatus Vogeliibacteriota TaxID=1817922 RepID=A0A1G2QBN6_9BACT|nr:MAG: hypothetical protein UV50_C0006G0040 [Parcubacteria group bacterium GW2011_GWB1_42_9]KKS88579.1 MAG: hypothetical protein UV64_C0020G0003 [Parcubacteria group bacterium GW2011_GWC1_43_11b]KKT09426.1 MAG: hypothetical protein UV88_C0010G0006 [Parcubacteria group bacterium GW2011_GWA1_43_21]OHA57975.1 MAG: hypothetical protein A2370_01110 [Candidatus Vogelbacteria bacterium RIFOXYB1_FULL_42_16]OHA59733.1 MAG: hypothetical protein A2607_02175 [Candidatus Vogelbacteria bacterium RIFOXYD1_FU